MEDALMCTEFEGVFLNADPLSKGNEGILEEKKGGCKKAHDELDITFNNLIHTPAAIIPKISRTPQVDPPLYHCPEFQQLSTAEKMKALSEYFKRLSEGRTKFARRSMIHASFSESICPIKPVSPPRSPTPETVLEGLETRQRVYTSRAGRQVKRKNYTEDFDMDSETEFVSQVVKKNKTPSSSNRLSNPIQNSTSSMKLTMSTAFEEEEEEDHTKNATARRNSSGVKKILASEDEIQTYEEGKDQSKTKLQSVEKTLPLPKRSFSINNNKSSRAEQMFDILVHDTARKEQEEEKMKEFENSLKPIDDEEYVVEESPTENFIKRRVPPQGLPRKLRGRKKINFQPLQVTTSPVAVAPPPSPSSPTIRADRSQKPKTYGAKASTKREKIDCPICNRKFFESEIEDHAARCGEDDLAEIVRSNEITVGVRTCIHCQKVLELNEYESHKMLCAAELLAKM